MYTFNFSSTLFALALPLQTPFTFPKNVFTRTYDAATRRGTYCTYLLYVAIFTLSSFYASRNSFPLFMHYVLTYSLF